MTTVTKRHGGLGRGLGDLIRPTGPDSAGHGRPESVASPAIYVSEGAYFAELDVTLIRPNPRQPRSVFDQDDLAELVDSIREVGLLQPVVARPLPAGGGFELVMGERRLRAVKAAGLATIPTIVRETDAADLLRDALLENLHRANLNPLEEAAAYQQMLDDFGCTQDELSARIKRSRPQISNTIRLLRLPAPVQRRIAAGVISAGHARALLSLPDAAEQERVAQRIVAEGLSVRAVEELVTLGQGVRRTRRPPALRSPAPRAAALGERLTDALDTRVSVAMGRHKGKITIEFGSAEDLDRILEVMRSGIDTQLDI